MLPVVVALLAFPLLSTEAAIKNPDTFTFLREGEPADSIDPAWAFDGPSLEIVANLYDFLVAYRGSNLSPLEAVLSEQVPSVANKLISADGRTYTFPIRKGVVFHDGTPLKPEDVKYSLMRHMLQDRTAGPAGLMLFPLTGFVSTRDAKGVPRPEMFKLLDEAITTQGDRVHVRLPRPYAPFLTILASFSAVVSKSWSTAHGEWDGTESTWTRYNNPKKQDPYFNDKANGTGPFMLERFDKKDRVVVLKRNDRYWRGPARLSRVILRGVAEFNTRLMMLDAGDADAFDVGAIVSSQLRGRPGIRLTDNSGAPQLSIQSLHFGFKLNPVANPNIGSGKLDGEGIPPDFFQDLDVRLGFAYALDYETAVTQAFRGSSKGRGVIPKGLVGYDPDGPAYTFDRERAIRHFKKAWGGRVWEKGFKVTLAYPDLTAEQYKTAVQLVKRDIEALNPKFEVEIRKVLWPTYAEMRSVGKLPLHFGGWSADFPDADNFVVAYLHSQGDYSVQHGYELEDADALIEEASRTLDEKKRAELYRRLQQVAFEGVPVLTLAQGSLTYRAERTWLKGLTFRPIFTLNKYYYDLYKEE